MATRDEYFDLINQLESARARLADLHSAERPGDPVLAESLSNVIADLKVQTDRVLRTGPIPVDHGLTDLVGLGDTAIGDVGSARVSGGIIPYDDTVTSERLLAIADLYYLYQHERMGVFRAVLKMQELFRAGQVRLSSGEGALGLYQYDRQRVLRYTFRDRLQAFKRVFGYTTVAPPAGSQANRFFHRLFTGFNNQVARFFRDQRISEVVRPSGGDDRSFGSIAQVRRAGLDLRSNLKHASYGHVNVMIVEVSQLLEFAFEILGSDDIRQLFGADDAWDVLEDILRRNLNEQVWASQRSRMAHAGREIIRWLAQPHILTTGRTEFEDLLLGIGEYSEEWLISAQSLGTGKTGARSAPSNVIKLRRESAIG